MCLLSLVNPLFDIFQEPKNPPTETDGGEHGSHLAVVFPDAWGHREAAPYWAPVLMDSCVGGSHEPEADVVFSGSGSSSPGAGACEEEEEAAQPGTSNGTTTQADDEPSTSACPPPSKRQRTSRGALMAFWKEEAEKEEQRFQGGQDNAKRFLDLF